MAADVEVFPRQAAMEGVYRGDAGIRRWWADLLDVFPDFAVEVIEVRDLGDMTLSALRFLGHGADTPRSETPGRRGGCTTPPPFNERVAPRWLARSRIFRASQDTRVGRMGCLATRSVAESAKLQLENPCRAVHRLRRSFLRSRV